MATEVLTLPQIASSLISQTVANPSLIAHIGKYIPLTGEQLAKCGVRANHVMWHLEHTPQCQRKMTTDKQRYLRWLRKIFTELGGYPAIYAAQQAARIAN